MAEYIDRETAIEAALSCTDSFEPIEVDITVESVISKLRNLPIADVQPVVRCKDCKYWKDARIKTNDGRERQYRPDEIDPNFGIQLVDISVGINLGSECVYEQWRWWMSDQTVFRNGDDFCSRGAERDVSYEKWWGIKDGYYADAFLQDFENDKPE